MPFPTQVNVQPAPAVVGDFASYNPRAFVVAGPGGLVAGPEGVTVGYFAWIDPANETIVHNYGTGIPAGFVVRQGQEGLITTYLAEASLVIPGGQPISLLDVGDVWALNGGSSEAVAGQKAYAAYGSGVISFAATGSATSATVATSAIAAATAISVTGTIVGNLLTVAAVSTGTVVPGAILTGTNVATGTQVTAQISGTTGGVGTYYVNIGDQSVSSETISGTYGILTFGATPTGSFAIGSVLSGSGVTTGTTVWSTPTSQASGGTCVVSPSQTASSETITATLNYETKFFARTNAPSGGLVKISSHPFG